MNSFMQNKLHSSVASPWVNNRKGASLVGESEKFACPKVKSVSLIPLDTGKERLL